MSAFHRSQLMRTLLRSIILTGMLLAVVSCESPKDGGTKKSDRSATKANATKKESTEAERAERKAAKEKKRAEAKAKEKRAAKTEEIVTRGGFR